MSGEGNLQGSLACCLALALPALAVAAEPASPSAAGLGAPEDLAFKAEIDGSTQRYVRMMPKNSTNETHDVLIALHGHGSDRWQYVKQDRGECKGARHFATEHGVIYISPDYRASTSWMGPAAEADMVQLIALLRKERNAGCARNPKSQNGPRNTRKGRTKIEVRLPGFCLRGLPRAPAVALGLRRVFRGQVFSGEQEVGGEWHKVRRVFLSGGSMGGTSVLIFAALHPELVVGVSSLNGMANMVEDKGFQDAVVASCGGDTAKKPEECRKRSPELAPEQFTMPVAFAVGGKDTSVPPDSVRRLAAKLETQNKKNVLIIEHPDGGHQTNCEDTLKTLEFILQAADGKEK